MQQDHFPNLINGNFSAVLRDSHIPELSNIAMLTSALMEFLVDSQRFLNADVEEFMEHFRLRLLNFSHNS
jgi:hypothetical protein